MQEFDCELEILANKVPNLMLTVAPEAVSPEQITRLQNQTIISRTQIALLIKQLKLLMPEQYVQPISLMQFPLEVVT